MTLRPFLLAGFCATLSAITILSVWSLGPPTGDIPQGDKFKHFIAYGALAFFMAGGRPYLSGLYVVAWCSGYGLFMELVQALTPDREASLADFAADLAGALVGFWVYRWAPPLGGCLKFESNLK